jgi:cation diffusion facilitator CzcD-associated flavoprotein CzcO
MFCLSDVSKSKEPPAFTDVIVIGAGWSGLLAAKHCMEQGLTVRILEYGDHVGGVWKYKEDVPGGVMKSTQTTSSWSFTEISDFPLENLNTDFPRHEVVQDYLERYAAHFKLIEIINFNCGAKKTIKDDNGNFNVFTTDDRVFVSKRLCVSTGFQVFKNIHIYIFPRIFFDG